MKRNFKNLLRLLAVLAGLTASGSARAEDGLYYESPSQSAPTARTDDGTSIRLGAKAEIQILKAHVYSENNANTGFGVRLETSDYEADAKTGLASHPVFLRVGERAYRYGGGGGSAGHNNLMFFQIKDRDEAKMAAQCLSSECALRAPPGYKILAQFQPAHAEFHTNEPVLVKFEIKNLDDRKMIFQRGGQQRGYRDNQYGFRATLVGSPGAVPPLQPVPDTGDPMNFGGLTGLATIEPGKAFEDKLDLKKWFAFDKPGTYLIHGFYGLAYYRPAEPAEAHMPWTLLWNDYASADFEVVIK